MHGFGHDSYAVIQRLFDQLNDVYAFVAESGHLVSMGICGQCAGKAPAHVRNGSSQASK